MTQGNYRGEFLERLQPHINYVCAEYFNGQLTSRIMHLLTVTDRVSSAMLQPRTLQFTVPHLYFLNLTTTLLKESYVWRRRERRSDPCYRRG